ncbi:MAG: succinate dehydrogenase, hydrophobic membrane anchor protein [Propionivibrio sp.]|jgi:succinate dehydrogenase / fumarate reductase membrane anchor subunit|uniref:Succinate dehydrogenase hydrophobic membrane anchor subunit n=1 Tax=Candidatus Propionivibrio dominans TaxID=2954373 RepID=A0A9D7FG19_9RHOO|nr:succinate dehydrogenase, hydrophobic membrane anchor protein [Candidatus Propionivibrio dominans]
MVNRILVGAHYGLKDWVIQRATAIIMALYTVIFFAVVLVVGPDSFAAWRGIFANGFMKFATFLCFVSLFYHAWIGIRDIWMDYIKPDGLRLLLMIATAAALVGYAGWAVQILWRI